MKKRLVVGILMLVMLFAVAACGNAANDAMFKISGLASVSFSAQSLGSIESVDVEYTEKDGSVSNYTGFPIAAVIELAGISDFSNITMIASDDYSAEVTADELADCADCIVALDGDGGWRTVMPGFSSKQQVKDLVELNIQ
jgi:hypothetical protein